MSPELKESADLMDKKIDDREFRLKFSLHINRNTLSSQDHSMIQERHDTNLDKN